METIEAYQHRRIATTMYVFAEKVFGRPLIDIWAGGDERGQSEAAKGLWSQPNRPFGNHPKAEDNPP